MDCPTWDGVLLATAAVAAAAIAAGTAIWRSRAQLDAEADRLNTQLAYDRWARNLDDLRRLVDEAATAGHRAGNALHAFIEQIAYQVEGNPPGDPYVQKRLAASDAVEGLQGYVERFEVRCGAHNEIARAMSAWQLAIEEALIAAQEIPPTPYAVRDARRMNQLSAALYVRFMVVARRYIERQTPPTAGRPS